MLKPIDIDKLFDEYISDYVYKNVGKVKPEEIENKIPVLYEEFGNAKLKELGNKTPNSFYRDYSASELLTLLKKHLEEDVSVSDFLCEAIIASSDGESEVVKALKSDESEQFTAYLMNMLSDMKGKIPEDRYFEFVLYDYPDVIGELATESLCEIADNVKAGAIERYKDADERGKARIAEILSRTKKDFNCEKDEVFDILVAEFLKHGENIPLYASYLARYGDDRALPFLNAATENKKLNYADFEELRFAIEALGGECKTKRDFSADRSYKKIKGTKRAFSQGEKHS